MAGIKYIKEQLDRVFIKRNAWIVGEMQRYYEEHGRPAGAARRMRLLLRLFLDFAVLKKNPVRRKQKELAGQVYPESSRGGQIPEPELTDAVKRSGTVVFDLWNVLVCPVLEGRYLSALVETVAGCPGMSGHTDLYSVREEPMRSRIEETAMDFCLDNEYMHAVWNAAKDMGKDVYLYNNSGFRDAFARKVAERFGYTGEICHGERPAGLYISVKPGNKAGICYRDVNEAGLPYRPFLHTNVVTDFYGRYVNLKLHAGWPARSLFYEYGFVCGGILTCGFCQYLNELASQKGIDKFLFVSRDGDVIRKVYDRYYKKCDTAYLIFSRTASYELLFEDFPEEYIDRNIRPRIGSGRQTVGEILQACGLSCLEGCLESGGLSAADRLDDSHYERLRQFLLRHKERAAQAFRDSKTAAERYFMREIEGYGSVCVVDLGWRGTSAVYLRYLFREKCGWQGNVTGALIGAAMDDVTQTYLRDGTLHAYAFDSMFYRRADTGGEYMLPEELFCMEALFSSAEPTFLRYQQEPGGRTGFLYGRQDKNTEMITEIQKGILDFAQGFAPLLQKYHLAVLPRDACTPLNACMRNRHYRERICRAYIGEKEALPGSEALRGE